MNILLIIVAIAIISFVVLYIASKNAHEMEDELPVTKFQPRKVTVVVSEGTEKPKRRYKKRNKKKKPTVVENTQVEKKPVGRPRKSN